MEKPSPMRVAHTSMQFSVEESKVMRRTSQYCLASLIYNSEWACGDNITLRFSWVPIVLSLRLNHESMNQHASFDLSLMCSGAIKS